MGKHHDHYSANAAVWAHVLAKQWRRKNLQRKLDLHTYASRSDQVCDVHGHLLNLRVVKPLDIFHCPHIIVGNEVNRYTFSTKSTTATDAMQVVLRIGRQVKIDHER